MDLELCVHFLDLMVEVLVLRVDGLLWVPCVQQEDGQVSFVFDFDFLCDEELDEAVEKPCCP